MTEKKICRILIFSQIIQNSFGIKIVLTINNKQIKIFKIVD